MKKLILISVVSVLFISCAKEKCTQCVEKYTQTKSSYCGKAKEVQDYQDNLSSTNASGYYQWQCQNQ